uniref:hypothetical protein n=1 Tax=unclassified Streptomyces TaxID=2593676 RepID=UPI0018F410C7|nr:MULTISPECIES: hypothetical protein [unclassified Streptomyces]
MGPAGRSGRSVPATRRERRSDLYLIHWPTPARDLYVYVETCKALEKILDVFGFELTESDLTALAALDRGLRTGPDPDTFN